MDALFLKCRDCGHSGNVREGDECPNCGARGLFALFCPQHGDWVDISPCPTCGVAAAATDPDPIPIPQPPPTQSANAPPPATPVHGTVPPPVAPVHGTVPPPVAVPTTFPPPARPPARPKPTSPPARPDNSVKWILGTVGAFLVAIVFVGLAGGLIAWRRMAAPAPAVSAAVAVRPQPEPVLVSPTATPAATPVVLPSRIVETAIPRTEAPPTAVAVATTQAPDPTLARIHAAEENLRVRWDLGNYQDVIKAADELLALDSGNATAILLKERAKRRILPTSPPPAIPTVIAQTPPPPTLVSTPVPADARDVATLPARVSPALPPVATVPDSVVEGGTATVPNGQASRRVVLPSSGGTGTTGKPPVPRNATPVARPTAVGAGEVAPLRARYEAAKQRQEAIRKAFADKSIRADKRKNFVEASRELVKLSLLVSKNTISQTDRSSIEELLHSVAEIQEREAKAADGAWAGTRVE